MRLLRDRRLAALLAAEVISSTGTQMTWLALPWFVLRTSGSPERMTWVIIAEVLPVLVAASQTTMSWMSSTIRVCLGDSQGRE